MKFVSAVIQVAAAFHFLATSQNLSCKSTQGLITNRITIGNFVMTVMCVALLVLQFVLKGSGYG